MFQEEIKSAGKHNKSKLELTLKAVKKKKSIRDTNVFLLIYVSGFIFELKGNSFHYKMSYK